MAMTPQEFMAFRSRNNYYARQFNFAGVYIIINLTKNMAYVGQSKAILDRVNAHFTGKGNGDIYVDFKNGDQFIIRMIAFEKSGFPSLNALERAAIEKYRAYYHGYNKTRGNR